MCLELKNSRYHNFVVLLFKHPSNCQIQIIINDLLTYNRRYYKEKIKRNEPRAIFLLDEVLYIDILGR